MKPLTAKTALDTFFLETRCKILDLAAILDRIGRGAGQVDNDPRLEKIRQALEILQDESGGRAERVQQLFSIEYDAAWEKPKPRF
ncbi:MAG: hypothetical protein EBV06_00050 [Planctomycetia bacterium]|nr:hypothetical protein [Planctomycetia bacterium]